MPSSPRRNGRVVRVARSSAWSEAGGGSAGGGGVGVGPRSRAGGGSGGYTSSDQGWLRERQRDGTSAERNSSVPSVHKSGSPGPSGWTSESEPTSHAGRSCVSEPGSRSAHRGPPRSTPPETNAASGENRVAARTAPSRPTPIRTAQAVGSGT